MTWYRVQGQAQGGARGSWYLGLPTGLGPRSQVLAAVWCEPPGPGRYPFCTSRSQLLTLAPRSSRYEVPFPEVLEPRRGGGERATLAVKQRGHRPRSGQDQQGELSLQVGGALQVVSSRHVQLALAQSRCCAPRACYDFPPPGVRQNGHPTAARRRQPGGAWQLVMNLFLPVPREPGTRWYRSEAVPCTDCAQDGSLGDLTLGRCTNGSRRKPGW